MKPECVSDRSHQAMLLRDGRRLGFAEYGDPAGAPLFYFHGWPSSRLEPRAADALCRQVGLRLIAPDRPGYGLSDFQRDRTIPAWTQDLVELADHLAIQRFAVLGISGGGPYAAACAANIPTLLSTALLVSSLAPLTAPHATRGMVALNRRLLFLTRSTPWLAQRLAAACLRVFWGTGDQVLPRQVEDRLPEPDKLALANPVWRETLIAGSREGLRPGVQGAARDGFLYARPWGFDLRRIRVPVRLWHGERDVIVPPAMGHYLADTIPGCRASFFPEHGHFSLPFGRIREILGAAAV